MAAKRTKKQAKLMEDAPPRAPAARRPLLLPDAASAAGPAAEPKDWKADPDVRAFAFMLSWDSGWMSDGEEIEWTYDEASKVVEVKRPATSASRYEYSRATFRGTAVGAVDEAQRRWGKAAAEKVRRFAYPTQAADPISPLGRSARYLKDLAARAWQAGATRELIEIALVDAVRHCADLARGANLGDPNPSAATTRAVASGAILELISPPPRSPV